MAADAYRLELEQQLRAHLNKKCVVTRKGRKIFVDIPGDFTEAQLDHLARRGKGLGVSASSHGNFRTLKQPANQEIESTKQERPPCQRYGICFPTPRSSKPAPIVH